MKSESIKDWVYNRWLLIINYISHNLLLIKYGRFKNIPIGYELKINDDFSTFNDNLWSKGQYFGNIHPDYPYRYAADECVEFTENGLILSNRRYDRTIEYWDGVTYNTEYDFGIVTSKIPFMYGVYEWEVIMPNGQEQWASLWLTGFNSWPPEIDVVESYSDKYKRYKSRFETNIHFGHMEDNTKSWTRALKSLYFREKNVYKPQKYRLIWEENKIEIFLNDYKVRVLTNPKILDYLRDEPMYVIMNNTISDNYSNIENDGFGEFIIKYFRYYEKK